jgi:hypothetical protein
LIKKLGIENSLGNPTYNPTALTKEEILDNYKSGCVPLSLKHLISLPSPFTNSKS